MIIYIYKRITLAILTMIAISLVTFFVIHAPAGDYVDYLHQYCSTIQCPYAVETEEEMVCEHREHCELGSETRYSKKDVEEFFN